MPEVFTTPGDQRDGCGPYGRHLTGAVDWAKTYQCGNITASGSSIPLVAGRDSLYPVPPPSESIVVDGIRFYIGVAGDATATIRTAIYDMETFPGGTLIGQPPELAIGVSTNGRLMSLPGPVTLRKNGRYAILICAAGIVLPSFYGCASNNSLATWLGSNPNGGLGLGGVQYTRAYGAFPATYNGVYAALDNQRITFGLNLP